MTVDPDDRPLTSRIADVARRAREACGPESAVQGPLDEILDGLAQPLRVAVAGRTKAGKSTLVNALLRQRVATTDVGECTRLVTCYRFGVPERVEVVCRDGTRIRTGLGADGALPESLPVADGAEIERVDVWLSNDSLRSMVLIDTPGLSSANDVLSGITREMLAIDDASRRAVSHADALVFVLALGARADDREALGRFRSLFGSIDSSAINAICVLNKADKVEGAEDGDGLTVAQAVAADIAPLLQLSVAHVVPSVALIGESVDTGLFTERHADVLRSLADEDAAVLDEMLLSVDRFLTAPSRVDAGSREELVRLLDLWGIRHGIDLVREGHRTGSALARELSRSSGIERVRSLLLASFGQHADALKAQWALAGLERLSAPALEGDPDAGMKVALRATLEELQLDHDMHRLAEVAAFQLCMRQRVDLPDDLSSDLEALLIGTSPAGRVGAPPDSPADLVAARAAAAASRWKTFANDPRRSPAEQRVAAVFVRSYELAWASLHADGQAS